jgi:hypothetical protein
MNGEIGARVAVLMANDNDAAPGLPGGTSPAPTTLSAPVRVPAVAVTVALPVPATPSTFGGPTDATAAFVVLHVTDAAGTGRP